MTARAEINLHEWLAGIDRKYLSAVDPIDPSYPAKPTIDERACRVCGCTEDRACDGGCRWVEDDLCSRCGEGAP